MFLHSGSRGVGNKIAQKHIKIAQQLCKQWWVPLPNPDLAYFPQGTTQFGDYLAELSWAQRFALFNRAEMMDRFRQAFACWMGADTSAAADLEAERINCHHNYTVQEKHGGKDVWLTRKGAVDAHEGVRAIIPGSMGPAPTSCVARAARPVCARRRTAPAGASLAPRLESVSPQTISPTE
jgi:tRNA-splicing ligase RtcB